MVRNNAECKKQEIMFNIDATYQGALKFGWILVVHHRWKSSGRLENVIYDLAGRPFPIYRPGLSRFFDLTYFNLF